MLLKIHLRNLAFAFSCLMIAGPALADKRVALVIGNSAYKNVARLDNPKNDAALMAETLRALGFTLVDGIAQLDLDKAGIDRAVQHFGDLLQGADVGLFYYAGHGIQLRGTNYLVPIDANPTRESDVDFQMLDANLVLRQMADAGTKLNMVILDACRNNPFGGRGLRAMGGGLAQMQAPEGTLISFATQPGNVAQDGSDGHSPYTKELAKAVRRPGLDIFRTFNEVGLAVMRATGDAQQPWISTSPISGDFYFAEAPAANAPITGGEPSPPNLTAVPPPPPDKGANEPQKEKSAEPEKLKPDVSKKEASREQQQPSHAGRPQHQNGEEMSGAELAECYKRREAKVKVYGESAVIQTWKYTRPCPY